MVDLIIIAVLAAILIAVGCYIYKERKRGVQCIGCPYASTCQKHNGGSSCTCSSENM